MRKYLSDAKYILAFLFIYFFCLRALYFRFHQPAEDLFNVAIVFGISFPVISWLLVRKTVPALSDRVPFKMRSWYSLYWFYGLPGDFLRNRMDKQSVSEINIFLILG